MKFSLDRNPLKEKKEGFENYIFFAVRNAKAEQIKFFIENYFGEVLSAINYRASLV